MSVASKDAPGASLRAFEARLRERTKAELRRLLVALGYEIHRSRAEPPWRPPGVEFRAGTILDVGAADGTPALYAAYPEANVVAFDPLVEQLNRLERSFGSRTLEAFNVALGAEDGEAVLHIPESILLKSSLHERTALTADGGKITTRTVPVRRLDDLVAEHDWPTPYVLKIDTEGHELAVLEGAIETLRSCAVVYTESSLAKRFVSGYRFRELSEFFYRLDFDLVDVLEAWRGGNGHVYFLDCVWVPGGAAGPASEEN
jgi:FkbM family methyltransferase